MIINCSLSEVELSAAFLPQFKTMFSPEMSSTKPDKAQKCDYSSRIGGASIDCEAEDAVSVLERFLAEPKNFNDVVAKIEKEMIRAVIEKTNSLQEAYELIEFHDRHSTINVKNTNCRGIYVKATTRSEGFIKFNFNDQGYHGAGR